MLARVWAEVRVAVLRDVPPARDGKLWAADSRLPANDAAGMDIDKFISGTNLIIVG